VCGVGTRIEDGNDNIAAARREVPCLQRLDSGKMPLVTGTDIRVIGHIGGLRDVIAFGKLDIWIVPQRGQN